MKLEKIVIMFFLLASTLLLANSSNANAEAAGQQSGIPILLYHHILKKSENQSPSNTNIINLEAFEEQMKYLSEQGYYTATLSDLDSYLQGERTLPSKTVVITFDDGHKTNYLYAYPVLKKYGFKAASFLITARISDNPVPFNPKELQFLSWPEIDRMKDVFQYGSHTNSLHYANNGKAALLSESEQTVLKDFETSRNLLQTDYLAYPFGSYNNRTIELLKTAGYRYAFTVKPVNVKRGNNPYELGRKAVFPTTSLKEFKELVKGGTSKSGWSKANNKWYYLDEDGAKRTGWLKANRKWYYLDNSGVMRTGWVKSGNTWYFLENSGAMKTGWLAKSGKWYYFKQSGAMKTGWLSYKNNWYYLDETGAMKIGWLQTGNNWYYLDASGTMRTGWVEIKSHWYYFDKNGLMATNTVIDGY